MECDFRFEAVPGFSSVLFDVGQRLRIDLGRWSPESRSAGGTIAAHLHYDPQIAPGRTTMEPDDEFVRLQLLLGNEPPFIVPFVSTDSQMLIAFGCDIDRNGDEVALICAADDAGDRVLASAASNTLRLIEMNAPEHLNGHARALFAHALAALPQMPVWQEQYGSQWSCRMASAYLPRSMAAQLGLTERDDAADQTELIRISSSEF